MSIKTINVEICGVTPLLFAKFDMEAMLAENGSRPKADKNELPREAAEKTLYRNTVGNIYIPFTWLFGAITNAGKFHKIGKNKVTTFKTSLVPAGISLVSLESPVFNRDGVLVNDFEVDTQSVVNPSTGGRLIKHRARLDDWKASFTMTVDPSIFSEKFARELVDDAGIKIGIGSYRPERKGLYGKFKVTKWEIEK